MAKPNDWICVADDDLCAAKSLLEDLILGPALYHTQQCAEYEYYNQLKNGPSKSHMS